MVLTTDRRFVILLGLCAQIILTALFLWRLEPAVETSLTQRAESTLRDATHGWARIDADGRDLTISGIAPNKLLAKEAIDLVKSVEGVRIVRDALQIARQKSSEELEQERSVREQELRNDLENSAPIFAQDLPYELHLQLSAGVLTLAGLVPDNIAKESLLNIANQHIGDGRVIDRLLITPGAPDGYLTAASAAIEVSARLSEGFIGINDREVVVQGVVNSSETAEDIEVLLAEGLPGEYTGKVQTGNRRDLEHILRNYPELAKRVGTLSPSTSPAATARNNRTGPVNPRPPATGSGSRDQRVDSSLCQQKFDDATADRKIGFKTGVSELDNNSQVLLDDLVAIAKQCPQARIQIGGHTDDQGAQQKNLRLSQRRAEAVMEHFVRNGVSLGRLSARGYGEDRPMVENSTAENRGINRRIEFKIVDEGSQ